MNHLQVLESAGIWKSDYEAQNTLRGRDLTKIMCSFSSSSEKHEKHPKVPKLQSAACSLSKTDRVDEANAGAQEFQHPDMLQLPSPDQPPEIILL